MKRSEKAAKIQATLDRLYPQPDIPLDHVDPFTLLVAVVLSAQTTDVRVNIVTPELFRRAPTPQAMAALTEAEILAVIRTVGLAPGKARHLKRLSELLLERHGGAVPADFAALEALPGVGHKTASVVMVTAFGVPAFPVDTHIHRLAARWGLSTGKNVEQTEADLKAVFPERDWHRLHLQIIYFGREHCPALRHDPEACPICGWAGVKARLDAEARARKSAASRRAEAAR
jgi:endonuclease-3